MSEEATREQVARAIWEASNPATLLVLTKEMRDRIWDEAQMSLMRAEYRRIAEAAINAMRAPVAEELRSAARDLGTLAARYMTRANELDPDPADDVEVDEADRDWP